MTFFTLLRPAFFITVSILTILCSQKLFLSDGFFPSEINILLFNAKETRVLDPWVRKMHLRNYWQPTAVFLPEEFPWTEEPGGLQSIGLESPKGLKRLSRDILNCWTTAQICVPSASLTWEKWKPQSKCSIPTVFNLISKLHLEKLHLGSFEKLVVYNFAGFWRRGILIELLSLSLHTPDW